MAEPGIGAEAVLQPAGILYASLLNTVSGIGSMGDMRCSDGFMTFVLT